MSGTSRAGVCLSLINNRGKEKGWVDFLEFRDYRPMGMERIGINPDTNLAIENRAYEWRATETRSLEPGGDSEF